MQTDIVKDVPSVPKSSFLSCEIATKLLDIPIEVASNSDENKGELVNAHNQLQLRDGKWLHGNFDSKKFINQEEKKLEFKHGGFKQQGENVSFVSDSISSITSGQQKQNCEASLECETTLKTLTQTLNVVRLLLIL